MKINLGISFIAACILCQAFPLSAGAKNDPVESEKTCQSGVTKKYKISPDSVKVVYRGDDSKGNHIVNYTITAPGKEDVEGICLVRIADSTVKIDEQEEFPSQIIRD